MFNANPSGLIGIGIPVYETPEATLHIGGSFRLEGAMEALDKIEAVGDVATEGFLSSGMLERENGGYRIVAVNPDGELIELPMSPQSAHYYQLMLEDEFFEQNDFKLGSGDEDEVFLPEDPFDFPYGNWEADCYSPVNWITDDVYDVLGYYRKILNPCKDFRVGIGTRNPTTFFHVYGGNALFSHDVKVGNELTVDKRSTFNRRVVINRVGAENWSYGLDIRVDNDRVKAIDIRNPFNETSTFRVWGNGKVSARAVHITDGSFSFPDYVFDPDYELLSIKELRAYIKENRSLPGVPTAKEVEEKGNIDIGKLQLTTLEKVEENVLYILELEEENKALQKKIGDLEERQRQFEKRLLQMEGKN